MEAMKRLESDDTIVIKPSDKGGNVVILDIAHYQQICESILSDGESYEVLSWNPNNEYREELAQILQVGLESGVIDKTEFDFILPRHPITATFYCLPKIHKGLNPLRDTPDLLRRLEGLTINPDAHLASIDVEALYSSIPHDKGSNGDLVTSNYKKPTATNALLHWTSHHPEHLKRGIPKGQYLRIRRNCSDDAIFESQAQELRRNFRDRGYPSKILSRAYHEARSRDRPSLLNPTARTQNNEVVRFITTFDNGANHVRDIVAKHWSILKMDSDISDYLDHTPAITYKKSRSLNDRLVHSHFSSPVNETWLRSDTKGCFKCGHCTVCQYIDTDLQEEAQTCLDSLYSKYRGLDYIRILTFRRTVSNHQNLKNSRATMKSTEYISTRTKWQVTFIVLFSWLCHSISGQIHYSIVEEMRKDSAIANIADDLGLDIKQLSSRKLRIVSRSAEKYVYVSLHNGNLYVKDRIDRETLCGREAICSITFDAVVENPFSIEKVKIEIQDINDNSPAFFSDVINLKTIELTTAGTRFALQTAEDPDIGSNSVQTYKLSDNQYFTLSEDRNPDGSTFLELVLEKPLDRETQSLHELILTAVDGGKPVRSGTALIRVIVTDANDNFPIFTQSVYKVSVNENTPINTTIITVNATDKDEGANGQITYSFSKTSEKVHHTGIFSVHPVTGEIKVNDKLDFEITKNFELSVQAKDGGEFVSHCKVLIEVVDENDNAPETSLTSLSSPIPEDSAVGTMIALIEVHDKDSGQNGEVDCKLLEEMPFNLVLSSDNYYRIVTTSSMDREKVSSYNITILATDRGSPALSSRRTITLEISDVNDNPPMFIRSNYDAYVLENNLPGSSIYSIQASDSDTGDNAKIFYSISNANTEELTATSYLSINIETGVLYAQRSFDYEQQKEFHIQINARDNGSPPLSSNTTLLIRIVDQNDNAPKILYPSADSGGVTAYEMVPFDSEQGSLITKVVAIDLDSGHNSWLSYHFLQLSEPSYFAITQHTGEIRTSRIFLEKDVLNHKIVVMVKDNGDPSLSSTVTLNLVIANNFQQMGPKFNEQDIEENPQSNLQFYLIIFLGLISLLFIITVMLVIISKCKKSEPVPMFSNLSSNLYPSVDPRILSQYETGTLPYPYSYNVCVGFDASESDFTYMAPNQDVPVDNLIDADGPGLGNQSVKEALPTSDALQLLA
ncbi:protocadherin gamma-B1-like [Ranitomeya variabilis]|uniref:protocadherin gamma-B1-like n=1 Tax=Ranitomeya variabilis TaxID=490064 RepID=UPI004055BA9D